MIFHVTGTKSLLTNLSWVRSCVLDCRFVSSTYGLSFRLSQHRNFYLRNGNKNTQRHGVGDGVCYFYVDTDMISLFCGTPSRTSPTQKKKIFSVFLEELIQKESGNNFKPLLMVP